MKVLTIREPWATMIMEGKKTIETRTWTTRYRGSILLHASKTPESKISGCIFAVAKLINCRPMTKEDEKPAGCKVYPKAQSWILYAVRPLKLRKISGKLGIWSISTKEWEALEIEK